MAPTCPICRAPARRSSILTIDAIAGWLAPAQRDADRHARLRAALQTLWPAGTVEICVCGACSFGFAWPLVAGDEAFYKVLHERAHYPARRAEFERVREICSPPAGGRVLDIGAGVGDFLATLPASLERCAIEASDRLCTALAARGIAPSRSLDEARGPFDLITMFHVVQYFADPVATLRQARGLLGDNGRLAVSVPNAPGGARLDDLKSPPHPLTRWSRPALERALHEAGLALERFEYLPKPPSFLLWVANSKTREAAAVRPGSVSARIDALRPGHARTALLGGMALFHLPRVLLRARDWLRRSGMLVIARADNAK